MPFLINMSVRKVLRTNFYVTIKNYAIKKRKVNFATDFLIFPFSQFSW